MRRPEQTRRARPPMPRLCVLGVYAVVVAAPLAFVLRVLVPPVTSPASVLLVAASAMGYIAAMVALSVPLLSWAMRRWPGLADPGDGR